MEDDKRNVKKSDGEKTKAELVEELGKWRTRLSELESREAASHLAADSLRSLVDQIPTGLMLLGPDMVVQSVNDHMARTFGFQPQAMLGRVWYDLVPAMEKRRPIYERVLAGESIDAPAAKVTFPEGERYFDVHYRPLLDAAGGVIGIVVTGVDITEFKQLEEKVRQVQKLESLGVLAGGIAHDFNNLLVGVLGNADLALSELAQDSPARHYVGQIQTAATHLADLTRQMLAFSGKANFSVKPIDLSRVVAETAQLLRISMAKSTEMKLDLSSHLPAIEADSSQIQQVVMNLVTNASEALGNREGTVTVVTGLMTADQDYLSKTYLDDGLAAGPYAFFEVSDNGAGMSDEARERMFDPFFTTKFTGRGLGLAAVLGIVRAHHGALKVESRPGVGTSVRVLFPASDASVATSTAPSMRQGNAKDHGPILLVDDEKTVRVVAKLMLEKAGFKVLAAEDGRQGLDLFRAHSKEIAAVVLDLTMPHINGADVLCEIRRLRDDVPVLLSSGYDRPDTVSSAEEDAKTGFLQKPYKSDALLRSLLELIE